MTSLAQESADHLIILPFEAWGHVRALCVLTARLVQARPLTITFFTTVDMYDRIDAELNRNFPDDKSSLKASYIRLVAIRSEGQNPLDMQVFVAAFPEAYRALVDEKPITCIKTGKILPGVPAPNAAILDMFLLPLLTHIQTLSRKPVKTFCWTPCAAYAAGGLVHVILQGPDGGLLKMIESISEQTGKPLEDVATEILDGARGIVGKVPGLPAMYDYEKEPQKMIIDMSVGGAFQLNATKFLQECDGVITSSPACYEPAEALSAFSDWLAQTSRKLYCVGPLLPLDTPIHAAEVEKALSADAATIDAFLNSMLQSHGAKSVIFVSFGSFFWSTEPEKIWAFLDGLLEKNVPFILSHGSPFAVVPDEISAKFNASGLGLLTRWAPQQVVLTHPAIGWFVTHAGFNSVIESIVAGVPMICWPFQAEQPMNAAHLTTNLDVAYELIEVRTGERGLQPIHRLGRAPVGTVQAVREEAALVLDKAFGEDGENKRANILKLREQVLAAWEAGGSGHRDLESLRDAICAT